MTSRSRGRSKRRRRARPCGGVGAVKAGEAGRARARILRVCVFLLRASSLSTDPFGARRGGRAHARALRSPVERCSPHCPKKAGRRRSGTCCACLPGRRRPAGGRKGGQDSEGEVGCEFEGGRARPEPGSVASPLAWRRLRLCAARAREVWHRRASLCPNGRRGRSARAGGGSVLGLFLLGGSEEGRRREEEGSLELRGDKNKQTNKPTTRDTMSTRDTKRERGGEGDKTGCEEAHAGERL